MYTEMTRHDPTKPAKASIEYKTLYKHLKTLEKAGELNGKTAKFVYELLDTPEENRLPKTIIGKLVGKSRHTITHWLEVLGKEKGE